MLPCQHVEHMMVHDCRADSNKNLIDLSTFHIILKQYLGQSAKFEIEHQITWITRDKTGIVKEEQDL